MIEAKDMLKSRGVNRESVEPELRVKVEKVVESSETGIPHSEEVLHNEFVNSLGGMRHIHFALSISEIGLLQDIRHAQRTEAD